MATVKNYDNAGNVCGEVNNFYVDDKVITTVTSYSNYGGTQRVNSQNVAVRDMKTGQVTGQIIQGGKLLP